MHRKEVVNEGKKIGEAEKVLIMLHGRGASARDIVTLIPHLNVSEYSIMAPQATNNTWYPYSFLAPQAQNEPWLTSALQLLAEVNDELSNKGISSDKIYFLGFSQGACLTLEFVSRNARKWGGVVAFTGGLIGDKISPQNYNGDFNGTPVFIGTSDPDPHVPVERVYATTDIMQSMNAVVTQKIYPNMGHTINQDEIEKANQLIFT